MLHFQLREVTAAVRPKFQERTSQSQAWDLAVPTASLPGPDECHTVRAEMGLEIQRAITALATDLTSQRASRSR